MCFVLWAKIGKSVLELMHWEREQLTSGVNLNDTGHCNEKNGKKVLAVCKDDSPCALGPATTKKKDTMSNEHWNSVPL